jgi:tetratricopeptide (TPR) repeat protein
MIDVQHPIPQVTNSQEFSRRAFLRGGAAFLSLRASRLHGLTGKTAWENLAPVSPVLCLASSNASYPPMLEKFISMLDPSRDIFPTEVYVSEIERELDELSASLRNPVAPGNVLGRMVAEEILATPLTPSSRVELRKTQPVQVEMRSFSGRQRFSRESFLRDFVSYLQPVSLIETADMEIYGIRVTGDAPLRVETDIRFSVVGTTRDKNREHRVGSWTVSWENNPDVRETNPRWTIREWNAGQETRGWLKGQGFNEVTDHCLGGNRQALDQLGPGIDDWRTSMDAATGIDVYGNHGIAAGDIDGSGFDSFYICQPSGLPNRLFRNRGDGTFADITESSGTGILDGSASAIFADFQNRRKQDLLVVRTGGPLLFVNLGEGRFEPHHDAFQFRRAPQGTFTSAAVADYDRDGFLDIYLCVYSFYQGLNQYQFPSPYYDAQNGPPNFLFRNRGDGTFEDVTIASGMDENNNRFSFAAAWCDYNGDGWPDLFVANDFGRKNLYRSDGKGHFTDVAKDVGVEDYGPGMSTCWLDIDGDGARDVYVANMWLPEGQRITADDRFLSGVEPAIRALYQKHNAGNSMYRNDGKGSFENHTDRAGTSRCGWSWSCGSWDFDHDGCPDVYVTNGFVSGPHCFDLQSFFWRQVAQRSMTPSGVSPEYELAWNAVNELVRSDYSWSGYERNVFFANNGDGTFSDISGVLGMDFIDDARAFALSDIDHDGRMEVLIKNRTSPQLRIVRNDLEGVGNSMVIRLIGSTSNRDAIGAIVTIESGAKRQSQFVSAGSGFASQHTKELLFGLGNSQGPVSISVQWPAGQKQVLENLAANHRIVVTEGSQTIQSTPFRTYSKERVNTPAAPVTKPSHETAATWLIAPLFGPDLRLTELNGPIRQLSTSFDRPVLLVFVKGDCGASGQQLQTLQQSRDALAGAGLMLYVVVLNQAKDPSAAEEWLRAERVTFPVCLASEREIGAWNIQYRYLFDRRRDMPLPCSFLLAKGGAIVAIYQGAVNAADVLRDLKNAPKTLAEQFKRAVPFAGPYYGGEMKHNYLTFGIAFAEYGYQDEAQAAFQRAVDADPNLEFGWFNLGTTLLAKKMYPEARKALNEAVRLNPKDSDAWNNLGIIAGNEQNYNEALGYFKSAALANPNNALAVENMMRIYQYQGKAVEAQQTLEELIARAPANSDLHLGLAMAFVAQNELQKARPELETAIRLRPDFADAINNLGAVLLRMGQAQDALDRFEEARRLAPDFDRAWINAAQVYNSMGQTAKAREVLKSFRERHPDNSDVKSALEKIGRP